MSEISFENLIQTNYRRYLDEFVNEKLETISLPDYVNIKSYDIDTNSKLTSSNRCLIIYPHYLDDGHIEFRYRISDKSNIRDNVLMSSIREYIIYGGVAKVENEVFEVYIPFNTTYTGSVKHIGKKYDMMGVAFSLNDKIIFVGASQSRDGVSKRYSGYIE